MNAIIAIPYHWLLGWYMKTFHPNFQEETIRGMLSKKDPNFKNLSEEKQKELVAEEMEISKKPRGVVL